MNEYFHHAILVQTNSVSDYDTTHLVPGDEVYVQSFEKLGVSDVRRIISDAHNLPRESTVQTFVFRVQFITLEAQNALLKVFEEPPVSSKFVLIVPMDFVLLPTLLSRCELKKDTVKIKNPQFESFVRSDFKERLEQIDAAQKKKDSDWQRAIKQGLITYTQKHSELAAELEYCARLLLTRGASNKFLLEHAALIIPARSEI